MPHGAVAEVTYCSTSLNVFRRMHIYTRRATNRQGRFPVLYLFHGACDSRRFVVDGRPGRIHSRQPDRSRKGEADGRGHARGAHGPLPVRPPRDDSRNRRRDEFEQDFVTTSGRLWRRTTASMPTVASRDCGLVDGGRAVAEYFDRQPGRLRPYRSLQFGSFWHRWRRAFHARARPGRRRTRRSLGNAELKEGLDLVWFATGSDDFLVRTSQSTVAMLKKHGFDVVYQETSGGHTWLNWAPVSDRLRPALC